jgi:hypothetical protein
VHEDRRTSFVQDVDVAFALSYHRHLDTVAGFGSSRTRAVRSHSPEEGSIQTMLLGWHLHLTA